jgi:adenosylcobinamide-GDP ribazoletransferase
MLVAVMFLTRFRVPAAPCRGDLGRAVVWFPIVGAALGLCGTVVAHMALEMAAVPPTLTALLLVSLGAWVTGAIHLDGLADAADGLGAGRDGDAALRIMRDPHTGAFGVVTLMLLMSTKVAALSVLLERGTHAAVLIAAPAIARWTVAPLGLWLPCARPGGLGEAITRSATALAATAATVAAIAIAAAVLRADAVAALAAAAAVTLAVGNAARRRIGGVTGDVFGACIELTETAVLVTGVLVR